MIKSHHRPWVLILPILVGLFFAVMNLSEWYRIGIQKATAGYPFGGEGPIPIPFYYKTPALYSIVSGISGTIFLSLTLLCTKSLFCCQRRTGFIAFALIVAATLVYYFIGIIEQ